MEKSQEITFKRGIIAGLNYTQEILRKKITDGSMQFYTVHERETIVQFVNSILDDLDRKKKINRTYDTEHGEAN